MATSSLTALLLSLTTLLSGLTAQLNNLQIKPTSQVAQVVSSSQKTPLTPSDFTYLGYYDVLVDGNNTTYSGGLTHRYVNGQLRLLILGLSGLKEMALPSTYGTRITNTTGNWTLSGTGDNLTGFWWDEAKQKLWVTSSIDYGSSNTYYPTKISTVTLGANGPVTNIHTVSLQGISSKRVYGGALALPSWFQSQYGCGPYAVGFGGYTSLMDQTSKASLGPELICIPDISNYANGAEIPTGAFRVLLDTVGNRGYRLWTSGTWPQGSPVNYFDGGDTRQNPSSRPTVPPASGAGYLSPNSQGYGWMVWGDSYYNTGMWIDTATKHGYVAVAALCKGFCWYQSSTLAFDGRTQELHIWDPNSLGNGLLTRPTSMTELNIPRGNNSVWSGNTPSGNISGATYDATTGRMYLYGSPLGPDVYTGRIYVYQVAGGGTGTPPPPSPTGTATDAVVSSWSAWTDTSGWSTCVNGTQTKTQVRTRTVITAATNGGYTPHLTETQTISQSCTTAPAQPVQTNPIGYWKLDETSGLVAVDSSGNGNNGTLNNGPIWITGKKANGLSFDGSDDHVLIGNPATLVPGSYITMMGWAKFDRADITQAIVSKYGNDSNITQLRLQGPGEVRCSVGGTTLTTTGAGVIAGNWHHLACTYDGSNITVYVDGVVKGTMSKSGSIADSTGVPWRIGSLDLNLMYMDGVIDEVKIYNRALSASEIATEITSASAPTQTTDITAPTVSITSPTGGTQSGTVSVSASASDNVGVAGVQFKLNGNNLGTEDTTAPYSASLDTTTLSNSTHTLTAVARDSSGNSATSQSVFITVSNVISNPQPTGSGTGLLGEYYDDYKLLAGDLKFTRVDPTVDFDWGAGSPSSSIASDSWGVVWKGKVEPRYSQSYTFIVNSDDGTRLWVNNQQIVNDWNLHSAQDIFSTPISLVAGQKYDIRLEYHDSSGNASAKLYWQSASQAREIIPATQLTPATVTTTPTTPISTKFSVGTTVQTTANVNVRSTPSTSGTLLGTQSSGSTGTVVGGPTYADGLHWWQINYASGADGWSAEDFLVAYSAPTATDAVVSAWSAWTDTSGWSTCVNGTQTKTQQRTRTVITAATNGGSTPALSETQTISQSCTSTTSPQTALNLNNFVYQGYHAIRTNGNDSTYSQGLTHRYVNGELRFISLTLQGQIQEYRLPAAGQTQTSVTGSWQIPSGSGNNFNGLWYEQAKNRLWVTSAQDYTATNFPAKVSLIQLNSDGTATLLKRFYLNVTAKRVYGGCQAVPAALVSQLGGSYVCGWGGYTSLVMQGGNASIGPTMYAIPDPDTIADGSTVTARTVLDTANAQTNRGYRATIPLNYFDGGDPRNNPSTRPTSPPDPSANWLSPNSQGYGWMVWGDSYYNTGFWIGNTFGAVASLCKGACWYQSSTLAFDGRQFELHTWDGTKLGSNILQRPDYMSELVVPISPTRMASGAMGNTPVNNLAGATYDPVSNKLFIIGFAMHDAYTARIYEYNVTGAGTPPPPSPTGTATDAVVSDWSAWTDTSGWSTCVNGTQTKTQVRTRTVITAATNGGSTPALSETRTISQSCTTTNQDTVSPIVSITSPVSGTQAGIVSVTASASDNVAVAGVQFRLNGADLGAEDTTSPYSVPWDTTTVANGVHQLNAVARDTSNNTTTSTTIFASVNNLTTTKFNIGDNIQTTANVNVRAVGGGLLLGTQPIGSTGKIIAGPTYSNGVTWWQIDYTSGVDGWSGEDYLVLYDASGAPTDAVVSDWSAWTDTSGWSTCVNGTQTKTQVRTRTVITAATNGGSTPALSETQTISQSCTTEGAPTSTKFSLGDNVQTIANVNVRSTPSTSGALLGTQSTGMTGKVVSGPVYADGLFWWQIDYSDGADGWSVEDFVVKSNTTTTPVTNKFIIGDAVSTTAKINVRSTAGGRRIGSQNRGANGTVIGGPTQAQGYTWWQINYDSGVDGWSVQDFLIKR